MGRRLRRLASDGAKFLAVGGVATLIALVLFNLLVHGFFGHTPGPMNEWPLSAFVLANVAGMLVSYRGTRSWAFRHRQVVGAAGGRVTYFTINTLTLAVPLVCLSVSRYLLGLDSALADNVAANVVGLALGTATRFWAFRRFVFVSAHRARARDAASP